MYKRREKNMAGITKKVKEKVKGAKDKVMDTKDKAKEKTIEAKDKVAMTSTKESKSSYASSGRQGSTFEEGAAGTQAGRKDDPLTSYREKEPMTPARIKEHEPTAVRRDRSDQKIVEPGQTGTTSSEEAAEIARKKGMAK